MKTSDKLVRVLSNVCSAIGLFVLVGGLLWSVCYVTGKYTTIVMNTYCAIAMLAVLFITIKQIGHVVKMQAVQQKHLKHERLLTYHQNY